MPKNRDPSDDPFNQTLEQLYPPEKKGETVPHPENATQKRDRRGERYWQKSDGIQPKASHRSKSRRKVTRTTLDKSESIRNKPKRSRKARSRSRSPRRSSSNSRVFTGSSAHDYRPGTEEQSLINAMCSDISEAIRDRVEFAKYDTHSVANTARILVRFGLGSFAEFRPARPDQRAHFIADAKKSYGFKSLKLTHDLFSLFPPLKRGQNIDSIEFNEVHLPKRLAGCADSLANLAGALRPTQEMVNLISEDIARGEANPQPFIPYVSADYHLHPWITRITAHANALTAWKAKNNGPRKKAISFQMRLHHHYRFIFAAEMANAWASFGGIVSQLNHIAVLLSLASLESAGYAIRYRDLLATTLADCARARFPMDYHTALSEVHDDTRRALLRENTTVAARFNPTSSTNEPYQRFPKGKSRSKGKGSYSKGGKIALIKARRALSALGQTL